MNKNDVNALFEEYKRNKTQEAFAQLYESLEDERKKNTRKVMSSRYPDYHAATEIFDDVLFDLIQRNDIKDFTHILRISLKNRRLDYFDKAKRRCWRFSLVDEEEPKDEGSLKYLYQAEESFEDKYYKKKEADKKELIDFLLESAEILLGSKMTAIIKELPNYESLNDAATSNGLKRNQVARPLSRLARMCSRKDHGDILDYFPDGVRIKREFLTA